MVSICCVFCAILMIVFFFLSSRRRHTRCALVTGVQTWALPICRSTLLQALAQAQSPTDVANLSQVVIFRNIDGRRAGAVFDVKAIREGRTPDPEILGGDVIVVGFDAVKGAFRDFFKMAPFFYVFRSEEHTSELQSLMRISYAVF